MKTVYKYPIPIYDEFGFLMPKGAEILHVNQINDVPYIWALVDTMEPLESYSFALRGTGHNADIVGKYIGTFQMHDGQLVFHLFHLV